MVGVLRAAARSESNGFQYLLIVWFFLTTCLIVGTLTVGTPTAAGQPFAIIDVSSRGNATSQLAPEPRAAELYPSASYAGATWSVVSSRLIPRTEALLSRPIVVVEAIVANTTEDAAIRFRDSDVAIVWPDDRRDHVDRFEQVAGYRSFTIEPGEEFPVTLVFKPQINTDPAMTAMVLEIQEPGRIPASVPLLGPASTPEFPITGVIGEGSTIVADQDNPGRQLIIAPLSVTLGLDAGPYRAMVGGRIITAEVSVQRSVRTADAAYIQPEFWRLHIGGESLLPVRVTRSDTRSLNEDLVTLHFLIDGGERGSDGDDVALIVAAGSVGEANYSISIPRLP